MVRRKHALSPGPLTNPPPATSVPPAPCGMDLVADVGGTHARFALCGSDARPRHVRVLECRDYASIAQAVAHYAHEAGEPTLRRAVMGVANPVLGDQVQMTNHPWAFSVEQTRRALGLQSLDVINDFMALALAVPRLPPTELAQVGAGTAMAGAPRGLIGPGTGLGVSALIPQPQGKWLPIATEGGHASFAPQDQREAHLWRAAHAEFGHASLERLLSGPGLEFIYRELDGLAAEAATLSAQEISGRAAENTCPRCRMALDTFCAILGTAASDLALTLGARGGIYIGGGIIPKLGDYFAASPFRARFEDKGRFSGYLAAISVFVIDSPYAALLGAAACLEDPGLLA